MTPSNELVAIAWISSIPGIVVDIVDAQLPADETTWAANGAVIVKTAGGSPNIYLPVRQPVVQVDCWADVLNSDKLPWNNAMDLAEQIRAACYDDTNISRLLEIEYNGTSYGTAWAESAFFMSEPHRAYSDQGDYAGASFDMQLIWSCNQA